MAAIESPFGVGTTTGSVSAWVRAQGALGTAGESLALEAVGVSLAPEGVIDPAHRRAMLEANLGALRDARVLDTETLGRLRSAGLRCVERTHAHHAVDNNVVLRDHDSGRWTWMLDANASPAQAARDMEPERGGMHAPVVLCGGAPALSVVRLHAHLRSMDPAPLFRRALLVVEEDLEVFGAAISVEDLSPVIRDHAVHFFLGSDAVAAFSAWLDERRDDALPKRLIIGGLSDPSGPAALPARVSAAVREQVERQGRTFEALRAANEGRLVGETYERARTRLREGVLGRRALRVLICTSRHSTYTRHSIDGLRAAYESLGHEVRLVMERDDSSVLTGVSYARAVDEHRPDFVVVVNYPRSATGGAIPRRIPFAMWIQDAMHHLFDPRVGASMDGWDVYAGATAVQFWEACSYRPEAALPYPVTACAQRFRPDPVDADLRDRFDCDVAFVSHHSETPEAMVSRLKRSFPPATHAMIDALSGDARDIVPRALDEPPTRGAEDAIKRRFRDAAGREAGTPEVTTLLYQFMQPLLGRLFRHEAVEMAMQICERRGWSFRLYGNGWGEHPRFAPHACAPVEHGEDLRACYQRARAHLHVDLNTLTHQRVFECALSGGLPVVRAWCDALAPADVHAVDELVEHATPVGCDERGEPLYPVSAGEIARGLQEERRRIGLPSADTLGIPSPFSRAMIPGHPFFRSNTAAPFNAMEVLGGVYDVSFTDERSLERVLERSIEDERWRDERSSRMRAGILAQATTEAFARRLLSHAARVLGWREVAFDDPHRCPTMDDVRSSYDAWVRALHDG